MLQSATTAEIQPPSQSDYLTFRRVRHISGIQIRNLTPFPVRDAFTSAISQPVEQADLSAAGIIDDPSATLSRVRSRRISTASVATRRSLKRDEGVVEQDIIVPGEARGRKSSGSRITFSTVSTSPSNSLSKIGTQQRPVRARTSSMTSSSSAHTRMTGNGPLSLISIPPLLPSNSQSALEKVISSRLVETFITITIPQTPPQEGALVEVGASPAVTSLRSAPASKSAFSPTIRPANKPATHSRDASASSVRSNARNPPDSAPPSKSTFRIAYGSKVEDGPTNIQSSRLNGTNTHVRAPSMKKGKSVSAANSQSGQLHKSPAIPASPVYFSPIHRVSTNPSFAIDPQPGSFPLNCNSSGKDFKVELWGKSASQAQTNAHRPEDIGRVKADDERSDWKILEEWRVNLDGLVPLPEDLDVNPSKLPFNTLVVTLQPPGQSFYLPAPLKASVRAPSPSEGYASEPESEVRKAKQSAEHPSIDGLPASEIAPIARRRRPKKDGTQDEMRLPAKTVTWQELFKLVTLQSLVFDTQSSLDAVVEGIDYLLQNDASFPLRREISEREARIRELRNNHCKVLDSIAQRKQDLTDRSSRLQERVEALAVAGEAIQFDSAANLEIDTYRRRLSQVRERTTSTNTTLLSTVTTIFPIELLSPPDLLFTILDVPLPIPLTANDPAPPLALPEHKDVNEDTVATALGYVAQVVQMLAAYLGKNLVYPVTCVGSRSLIRDGISSMVGPRMFPLFPRGVDTYRFEYGVFLLNKNIEMLMAERDLRALDMRHTLPNLKNLLLTLSHDALPQQSRRPPSTISPISSLSAPSRETSPSNDEPKTPIAPQRTTRETASPTASGSTTPVAPHEEPTKGKSFLGFVPFTDFLRRYPSQSSERTIMKHGASTSDSESNGSDGDDEDRKTINGVLPAASMEVQETLPIESAS
ncbi:hypothetical protein CPB83DRAFT_842312 [Crepidotus variabilis]|uniref:Autophagy-related protein 14 n=1 Tax=Crepidotus variabilis TaxID=179855 RepID=A0A9P6EUX8_9AGAR|nr:hypothetical protein CPB83DRAFT_842312 [Crepidotus variabilis]